MSEQLHDIRTKTFPPMIDLGFAPVGANRLLARLPPEDFDRLAPHLVGATYEPGSVLHEAGQPITHAYFLDSGLVSLLAVMPDGHAIGTCMVGREGAVGLSAGLYGRKALTRAVVYIAASVAQVPIARLVEAASESNSVRDMILRCNHMQLKETAAAVACSAVHHIGERVAGWLLRAHERTGTTTLPLTQECLAGVLGVQRTTVTYISRRLQAAGAIKVRRGRIQIRDLAALQRNTCSCHSGGAR